MKREYSAGGVVVRENGGTLETVVISPRAGVVALPKGHPDGEETLEQAATREVREETGVVGESEGKLGDVQYWYSLHGQRVLKTVAFFLFRYLSGDVADHDDEVLSADWVTLTRAPDLLSYSGEQAIARTALERLTR